MKNDEILRSLMESVKTASQPKTSAYDTTAEVRRIEGNTAWVHIAGGVDETPVKLTVDAKAGDTVQVRVSGGTAFLVGNGTAPPTDDTRAIVAQKTADTAQKMANTAVDDAERAKNAADSAQASAASAQVSANNANEYASRALGGLSTVQSVTETLNWITQHGTMTLTTDTALDPTHVYFVVDAQGDYVVGNTHYSIVTEPNADDLGNYYVLSIDESLQNYVGTHLALTSEGLWVLPASTGYKVLIATGNGTTYTSAGTYIIDSGGAIVAKFGETVQIGETGQSHLVEDYHSLQLVDKEGSVYFYVSDLRNEDGYAQTTEYFTGDGSTTDFIVTLPITSGYGQHGCSATVDDVACTIDTDFAVSTTYRRFRFTTAPSDGAQIAVTYYTTSQDAKAYTLGKRLSSSTVGPYSLAEGENCTASGWTSHAEGHLTVASSSSAHAEGEASEATGGNSHAEGWHSKASGNYSHAEGYNAKAKGMYSHAEGYETVASGNNSHAQGHVTEAAGNNQTVIGKYNVKDTANKYALIIGNGTSASAKSNGLTVDWDGNLKTAGAVNGIKVIANNYYDRDSGQTKTFTLTTLCGYMLYVYRYNTTSGNGMYIISAHTSATAIDAVKSTSNVTVTASGLTLNVKLNSNYVQLVLVKMTA